MFVFFKKKNTFNPTENTFVVNYSNSIDTFMGIFVCLRKGMDGLRVYTSFDEKDPNLNVFFLKI